MSTYTFVIGSIEDFEHPGNLDDYVEKNGSNGSLSYSVYEIECPADCSQEIVTMIGRGYAFSNGWCMDDTFSWVIEGSVSKTDGPSDLNDELQNHDLWEIKRP